jgi:hypothetical protein
MQWECYMDSSQEGCSCFHAHFFTTRLLSKFLLSSYVNFIFSSLFISCRLVLFQGSRCERYCCWWCMSKPINSLFNLQQTMKSQVNHDRDYEKSTEKKKTPANTLHPYLNKNPYESWKKNQTNIEFNNDVAKDIYCFHAHFFRNTYFPRDCCLHFFCLLTLSLFISCRLGLFQGSKCNCWEMLLMM